MPNKPKRQTSKERALSNIKRDERIAKVQSEQEKKLRRTLSDGLSLKRALSNAERDLQIEKKQAEQEQKLRREFQE